MSILLIAICIAALLLIVRQIKRLRDRKQIEQHSITPEQLHTLLATNQEVLVFDVRRPLELLADSEIIPGAKRIPPRELLANPSLIPKDKDSVLYCTCIGDETSRSVLHLALGLNFHRIKFLKGGLAAWKAEGYPVKPYLESFPLETAS
ncbi:MAG: Rhodanese-related sulfurtransferase [Candidatus Angelobacter sp.]|jgi:rhodanese-related sulfurtransferase|nr:Rhodanese-related sulfurtransferase [Candidatus Angelobacter sp.]